MHIIYYTKYWRLRYPFATRDRVRTVNSTQGYNCFKRVKFKTKSKYQGIVRTASRTVRILQHRVLISESRITFCLQSDLRPNYRKQKILRLRVERIKVAKVTNPQIHSNRLTESLQTSRDTCGESQPSTIRFTSIDNLNQSLT